MGAAALKSLPTVERGFDVSQVWVLCPLGSHTARSAAGDKAEGVSAVNLQAAPQLVQGLPHTGQRKGCTRHSWPHHDAWERVGEEGSRDPPLLGNAPGFPTPGRRLQLP